MALRMADTHFPKIRKEVNGLQEQQENKSLSSDEHQKAEGTPTQQIKNLKEGTKVDQSKQYPRKRQRKEEKQEPCTKPETSQKQKKNQGNK